MKKLLLLVGLVLALPGCRGVPDSTQLMVAQCYNFSRSAEPYVGSDSRVPQVTNQVILAARIGVPTLTVASISKHPVYIDFPTNGGRYPEVRQALEEARKLQSSDELQNLQDTQVKPNQDGTPDIWGYGTDHAATLRGISLRRPKGTPLLIILFTDGFNESRPFDEVRTQIARLFEDGPTRLIVLGVSQHIVDSATQTTQLDRWREMLDGLGLINLGLKKGLIGYYLSSDVALPDGWNSFP